MQTEERIVTTTRPETEVFIYADIRGGMPYMIFKIFWLVGGFAKFAGS